MPGNIFLAYAAPFHILEPTRLCLVSLTSVPMQTRAYPISDWLSMVLWCDDSQPKSQASIDAHYDSFAVHHFFKCFNACHKLRTHGYRRKNLDALHGVRIHDAGMQALFDIMVWHISTSSLCVWVKRLSEQMSGQSSDRVSYSADELVDGSVNGLVGEWVGVWVSAWMSWVVHQVFSSRVYCSELS